MKLVCVPIFLLLILCALTLLLINFSFSFSPDILGFSSSNLFVFSVFQTLICVILAKSYSPSPDAFDGLLHVHQFDYTEELQTEETYGDDNEDNDSYYYDSDGYDEDDDDNGSDGVVGWDDDEEEFDDDLESKIEGFIAKVVAGWKEELLREKLHNYYVD
ncbi:uncharacterized protein LOC130753536 [Actinidia eriantha]|uniref:uncharacterized protein LOC130753536 n=1 Tax=Actinidia eriantha TaxID=165200 RepID=UPI002591240A|nr:uncharacterized protein LOC130753536 [Actinidia eriantha]